MQTVWHTLPSSPQMKRNHPLLPPLGQPSIRQSFATGKPVAASRIGGIPELIDEGQDGLLFSPGDANELAACLRRLWDNPEQTRRMGLNGRRKVLAQYSPENHYRQLYPLYKKLANGRIVEEQ